MHHLIDTKLEVKIYGREHHCYVLVRDSRGEYEVEITPTPDGRLDYVELMDHVPINAPTSPIVFNVNNGNEGVHSI